MWLLLHEAMVKETLPYSSIHVYRGVSVRFAAEVGQVVAFKQFTSTTKNINVAKGFLGADKTKCTLLDIEIYAGLPMLPEVDKYGEEEILLAPNDALEVVDIKEKSGLRIIYLVQKETALF